MTNGGTHKDSKEAKTGKAQTSGAKSPPKDSAKNERDQ